MSAADPTSVARWISLAQAARILGKGPEAVRRTLDLAGITRQDLPGCHPRWALDDVIRLAERCVRRPEPPERTIL